MPMCRLDVHILDYLKKRNLHETASSFKQECKASEKPHAIDAPSGFLFEWWTIFWDIYIARTNPAFSEYASTYTEAQKAKGPLRQQHHLQQLQVQQMQQQIQQSMLQRQLIREKNLQPEHAAQLAQHITSGRIRVSELGSFAGMANQEQLLEKLQDNRMGSQQQHPPFQGIQVDEPFRGSLGSLASPALEKRPGSVDPMQRQQLVAAFQAAAQRSSDQASMANNKSLNQLLGGVTPQTPTANLQDNLPNPWPMFGQSLAQRDLLPAGAAPSMTSPQTIPLELRQQALQKLQQQQQQQQHHQQGAEQGMSGGVSTQPGSSRQSSGTVQRNFQSPTLATQPQSQLNLHQLMLLQHMQQQGQQGGPPQQPDAEARQRLLAQLGSRAGVMLRPGPQFDGFGTANGITPQDAAMAAAALQNQNSPGLSVEGQQQQEQQRLIAELRAHHQQQQQLQQARAGQPIGMLSNPNINVNPNVSLKLGPGDRSTPSIMELDRQIASSDSGQNRNSPANSTAAGSSLQNGRATPGTISSGHRRSGRPNGGKPASGLGSKKRKHSASTSPGNSESQDTPSSNTSGGSGSQQNPASQALPPSNIQPLGGLGNMASHWDSHSFGGRSGSLLSGGGMNAAAAALDCSTDGILNDIMGDESLLDPSMLLSGDGDPTDATFLGVDGLGMDHMKASELSHVKDLSDSPG
ncbi:TPA: hypothetical protein ACH3X1_010055 [Trebouxia sp. C0004]